MRSHLINFYCQYHFCALKYSSKITLFRNYKNISIGSGFYLYEDYDFQPNLSWQFPFSFWLIPTTFYWTGFGSLPHGTPSQWASMGNNWVFCLFSIGAPLKRMVTSHRPCSYTLSLYSRHKKSWLAFNHPLGQPVCLSCSPLHYGFPKRNNYVRKSDAQMITYLGNIPIPKGNKNQTKTGRATGRPSSPTSTQPPAAGPVLPQPGPPYTTAGASVSQFAFYLWSFNEVICCCCWK